MEITKLVKYLNIDSWNHKSGFPYIVSNFINECQQIIPWPLTDTALLRSWMNKYTIYYAIFVERVIIVKLLFIKTDDYQ